MGKSKCLKKGHWESEETGEKRRGGIALAPEVKAQGEFIKVCKYLMGRTFKQFLHSDIQWENKREWAQIAKQDILLK